MSDKPKRKKPFSSTAATLKWARGIWGDDAVAISSWWQGMGERGGVRKDLFGFADALVLDGLPGVLALQACGSDIGAHKKKLEGRPALLFYSNLEAAQKAHREAVRLSARARLWLLADNRLLIVAWRPVWRNTGPRTKMKKMTPRFIEGRLTPHPPGLTLGASDRELEWVEHETWPAEGGEVNLFAKRSEPVDEGTPTPAIQHPPQEAEPEKTRRLNVAMSPDVEAVLRAVAARTNISMADLRRATEESQLVRDAATQVIRGIA